MGVEARGSMGQTAKQANSEREAAPAAQRGWFTVERLAVATVVLGYILILIGGVVRIEGAGMGCGDDWPICNGKVIPTFSYLTTIEYLHRVVAGAILLLTSWLVFATWRQARRSDARRWLTVTALVLVLAQALLGAVTVFAELDPRAVTAHLGMAQAYFAIMIVIAFIGYARPGRPARPASPAIVRAAIVAIAATFGLLLTGAYTASSGAAWACPQWPLCHGKYFPTGWTSADVHILHRWLALITIGAIVWLLVVAVRDAGMSARVSMLAGLALALTLIETLIGAANIWTELANWVRISHLAFATLVWGALIVLVAEWLPLRLPAPART